MEVRRFPWTRLSITLMAAGSCLADFQVNTYTNRDQYSPFVAMNDRGDAVVVWRSSRFDGRGGGVFGRLFDPNGQPRGDEFQINLTPASQRTDNGPCAVMRDTGAFVVTWVTTDDGSGEGIVARRFAADAAPLTGEMAVNTYTHLGQGGPALAMKADGDWVAVWESWHGTDDHNGRSYVTGRLFDANDRPKGDEFIITQSPHGQMPKVAMDQAGDFVVTWLRQGGSDDLPLGTYIQFRRYHADGTPKGDEVQITEDLVARVQPAIGMDRLGNFTIARSSYEGDWDHTDVYAHRFDARGQEITPPFLVNSHTDGGQLVPSIALTPDGRAVVVWCSRAQDGTADILGRRYDSAGLGLGDEFRVNDGTLSEQTYPEPMVAARADGACAVVWTSFGPDGSRNGVFLQTFRPEEPPTGIVPAE